MKQRIRIPANNRAPVLERIGRYLLALPADKEFVLAVEPYRKSRSLQQNAYLWQLYTIILENGGETLEGWTKDDLHDFFLIEHFGSETISGFGRLRHKPLKRSSGLSTVEFSEFVAFIQQFMAERGVYLPDPNEMVEA